MLQKSEGAPEVGLKPGPLLAKSYSLILFFSLWEIVAQSRLLPPLFLPSLSSVVVGLVNQAVYGKLIFHVGQSMVRLAAGFAIALLVGIPLGLTMARIKRVREFFEPLVFVGFPAPKIAFFPTFLVLFGIGHASKIVIITLGCIFPIVIMTFDGARSVERNLLWSALSMGSKEKDLFRKIILPASLPYIFSGIRISLFASLIIVVVAEMVAAGEGLGHFLIYSERTLETVNMFVALVTIAILGLVFDRVLLLLRSYFLRWSEEAEFL